MTSQPEPANAPSPIATEAKARRRSAAVVLAATVLAGGGLLANFGGWHSDKASAVEASITTAEQRLAEANAETSRAERRLAELERKRADAETAITESARRVAMLDERRNALQRQVEELAGPVSATDRETPVETQGSVDKPSSAAVDDGEPQALARRGEADDASSPDATLEEGQIDAPSEPAEKTSTASVDGAPTRDSPVDRASVSGPVRVFIHIQSADRAARARAQALAADLRRRGVEVAQIRGVRLPIRENMVRYFYDADREAVSTLQSAISENSGSAARAQDFRGFSAAPRPGTLEIWMS